MKDGPLTRFKMLRKGSLVVFSNQAKFLVEKTFTNGQKLHSPVEYNLKYYSIR